MFYSRQKQLAFDKVELEYQKIMMVCMSDGRRSRRRYLSRK